MINQFDLTIREAIIVARQNDRLVRTFAVKPHACGAPCRASGLDRSALPSKVLDRAVDA
jgi:hypothetical protein